MVGRLAVRVPLADLLLHSLHVGRVERDRLTQRQYFGLYVGLWLMPADHHAPLFGRCEGPSAAAVVMHPHEPRRRTRTAVAVVPHPAARQLTTGTTSLVRCVSLIHPRLVAISIHSGSSSSGGVASRASSYEGLGFMGHWRAWKSARS